MRVIDKIYDPQRGRLVLDVVDLAHLLDVAPDVSSIEPSYIKSWLHSNARYGIKKTDRELTNYMTSNILLQRLSVGYEQVSQHETYNKIIQLSGAKSISEAEIQCLLHNRFLVYDSYPYYLSVIVRHMPFRKLEADNNDLLVTAQLMASISGTKILMVILGLNGMAMHEIEPHTDFTTLTNILESIAVSVEEIQTNGFTDKEKRLKDVLKSIGDLHEEYYEVITKYQEYEEKHELLKQTALDILKEADLPKFSASTDSTKISIYSVSRKYIDEKRLKNEKPDIYADYSYDKSYYAVRVTRID